MKFLEQTDIEFIFGETPDGFVHVPKLREILQDHFEFRTANLMSERQAYDDLKKRFAVLFKEVDK